MYRVCALVALRHLGPLQTTVDFDSRCYLIRLVLLQLPPLLQRMDSLAIVSHQKNLSQVNLWTPSDCSQTQATYSVAYHLAD